MIGSVTSLDKHSIRKSRRAPCALLEVSSRRKLYYGFHNISNLETSPKTNRALLMCKGEYFGF